MSEDDEDYIDIQSGVTNYLAGFIPSYDAETVLRGAEGMIEVFKALGWSPTPQPAGDLSTERVVNELARPIYVMRMASGARDIRHYESQSARSRSLMTRYDQGKEQVEKILARWRGPDE